MHFMVIFISLCGIAQSSQDLKVSIFYEALCPDSVRFFTSQLKPAYPVIGDHISIEFIPYGKATHFKRDGKWTFRCHHGQNECYANQIQACAVHQKVPEKSKVNFLLCLMSSSRYDLVNPAYIEKCAKQTGLSHLEIFACMRGDLKDNLLAQHGERTLAVDPIINFVPTIIFNNAYDPYKQNDAMDDFLGTVCEQLSPKPRNCPEKQARSWFSF